MQRRTFMNMTAGAMTALALDPLSRATQQGKNPVAYPDPAVEIVDQRFAKYRVQSAAVERLYTGTRWAEGPVWFGDGRYLLFSDIPNNHVAMAGRYGRSERLPQSFELQQRQLSRPAGKIAHLRARFATAHPD